jgi:tRNA(Ile)-lysidine synthase
MPAIKDQTFATLMEPLGPFEDNPHLAVAVSGGADSMALALLAHAWARHRGGTVTALTVDHGLRPEAAGEARQVGDWLTGRGIAHETLVWRGPKPRAGIQAAARTARYDLLAQWCRGRGVLHLLAAHHGDDQAETVLLRRDMNSGIAGLSGMAPVRAMAGVRLLRPLLSRHRAELTATLKACRQPWLEDPSNQDLRYARIRARRGLETNVGERDRLLALAGRAATARGRDGHRLAHMAARSVRLHPAGYCWFDPAPCLVGNRDLLPPREFFQLLGDVLRCIGGGVYRPRRDRLERLGQAIIADQLAGGRTLGGARVLVRKRGLLVCREIGRAAPSRETGPDRQGRWDRFTWSLSAPGQDDLSVGPLGQTGWRQIKDRVPNTLPSPVRAALPALRRGDRILAVPHLNWRAPEDSPDNGGKFQFSARFTPVRPLQPNDSQW